MRKLIKLARNILFALCTMLIVSCPATPSQPPNSGTIPYEKPDAPSNVKATRGQNDSLIISWDPVDNANLYIIYGVSASDFGTRPMEVYAETNSTSYTFKADDRGSTTSTGRVFNSNESYIFSVCAWVNYGSSSMDNILSENSDYVEGCFAPTELEMYAVITYDSLLMYWSVGNLFSTLNNASDPVPLYTPEFILEYKEENAAEWKQLRAEDYQAGLEPWYFESVDLDTAEYNLEYGKTYIFRVSMQIIEEIASGEGEEPSKVEILPEPLVSEEKHVLIDTSLIPDPVENLTASAGIYADEIEVSWTIPAWGLDVSRANSYFRVQRSIEGASNWVDLVDEISAEEQSGSIEEDAGRIVFHDRFANTSMSPKRGVKYEYRIINSAMNNGILYSQDSGDAAVSDAGYLFDFDSSSISLTGNWTNKGTAGSDGNYYSADVTLDISDIPAGHPEELVYAIERQVQHVKANTTLYDYVSVKIIEEETAGNLSVQDFTESVAESCSICGKANSEHRYAYSFVILESTVPPDEYNQQSVFDDIRIPFKLNNDARLGDEVKEFMITSLKASNDRIGSILIEWTEMNHPSDSAVTYQYSFGNDHWSGITAPVGSVTDGFSYEIEVSDHEKKTISFRGIVDGDESQTAAAPYTVEGRTLDISGVVLSATEGAFNDHIVLSWNDNEDFVQSGNVEYKLEITTGTETETIEGYTQIGLGYDDKNYSYVPSDQSLYGEDVTFKIIATNTTQSKNIETTSATGYVLPIPEITSVSKGTDYSNITIAWDSKWSSKVGGYRLHVYSDSTRNNLVDETPLHNIISSDSSSAAYSAEVGQDYYFYLTAVSPAGDSDAESLMKTEYETEENILKRDEAKNMGYVFNNNAITDVSAAESYVEENGKSYVSDYFTVTFPANKTAEYYVLSGGTSGFEGIDEKYYVSELIQETGSTIYTNGKADTVAGYMAYDPSNTSASAPYGTITINTATGILDDSYLIPSIKIVGCRETDSTLLNTNDTASAAVTLNGISRAMNSYDYINVFNQILNNALNEIDDEKFHGEWTKYHGNLIDNRDPYQTDHLYAIEAGSTLVTGRASGGVIRFTDYEVNGKSLVSNGDIPFTPLAGGWNGNKVAWIGNEDTETASPVITMAFDDSENVSVGSRTCYFRPAEIRIYYINISEGGMPYAHMAINGEDCTIDDFNKSFIHHYAWE